MALVLLRVGAKMAAKHLTTYEIPATPTQQLHSNECSQRNPRW